MVKSACTVILALFAATVALGASKLNSGPAVSVGLGNLYGGDAGGGLEYQILLAPRFRLTPFAAVGVVYYPTRQFPAIGYCGGGNLEYGRWHRAFAGLSFGTQYRDQDSLPVIRTRTMVGPALCLGYKGMAPFGLFWQACGSLAYIINPVNNPNRKNTTVAPAISLGLGYKP